MAFCVNCGASLNEGSSFCHKCGAAARHPNAKETSANAENRLDGAASVGNATNSSTHEGCKEAEGSAFCPQKKGSTAGDILIKIVSILLCIVFGVSILGTSILGIARGSISTTSVKAVIKTIDIDNIEEMVITDERGKEKPVAKYILDFCSEEVKDRYNLDEDSVIRVLKKTKADEFLGEVLKDYSDYFLKGENLEALTGARVVKWIRANEEQIESITEYEFKPEDYRKLEQDIDNSGVVKAMSEKGLKKTFGGDVAVVRTTLSVWIYVVFIALTVVIGALIVAVNRRKVRACFTYVAVTVAVIGALLLILSVTATVAVSIALQGFIAELVKTMIAPIVVRGAVFFIVGLASAVIYAIVSKKRASAKA